MAQIHYYDLTEEQQEAFIRGWERAGGFTSDGERPWPFASLWEAGRDAVVQSCNDNPEDWGAQFWEVIRHEFGASRGDDIEGRIAYHRKDGLEMLESELDDQQLFCLSDEEFKEGRSAEAYFESDGVAAYTRTENTKAFPVPDTDEDWIELVDRLIKEAGERATFVVGTKKEARESFDAKYGAFM